MKTNTPKHNIIAKDAFLAAEHKLIAECNIERGETATSQIASGIKYSILLRCFDKKQVSSVCIGLYNLKDKIDSNNLPEIVKILWLDGFDVKFELRSVKISEGLKIFGINFVKPDQFEQWNMIVTPVSQTPRDDADYVPIQIPNNLEYTRYHND